MKTWILSAFMAVVFAGLGLALAMAAFVIGEWPLLGGGAIFLVVGLTIAWFVPAARREQNAAGVEPSAAAPGTVPFARVADLIRERLVGSPYTVELEGSVIRVHADLADAEYLGWASAHKVKVVRGLEVIAAKPGVALTRDFEQDLDLSVGAGRLSGRARVQSGRSWSFERRIEFGMGTDGRLGRQVDVRFSSREIQAPVNAVLKETGWYTSFWSAQPADAKIGLVVGAIGGVGGLIALVGVAVAAILGKLG